MKALACEFTLVYAKLYRKAGLQIKLLSASSQISSSDAFMDRVVTRSVNHNHEAVMLDSSQVPPRGGVDSDGIREAIQAREELPTYHRQNPSCP